MKTLVLIFLFLLVLWAALFYKEDNNTYCNQQVYNNICAEYDNERFLDRHNLGN